MWSAGSSEGSARADGSRFQAGCVVGRRDEAPQGQGGDVVRLGRLASERVHRPEHAPGDGGRRLVPQRGRRHDDPLSAEERTARVLRLGDAVGVKDDRVARLEAELVDGEAGGLDQPCRPRSSRRRRLSSA